MIVFVGSNPSNASPDCSGFHLSTKSRRILDQWCHDIEINIDDVLFINVCDTKTLQNKPLTIKQIRANLPILKDKLECISNSKIIALGRTAERALTLLRVDHFAAPHPSGLNRKLNDKEYVKQMISELKQYLR